MEIKKLYIKLGISVALFVAFLVLSMPQQPEPAASDNNTFLYQGLSARGIMDAAIDISEDRVLVRYNLPDSINKNDAILHIAASAAVVAPETQKIIIQTYQNFEPVDEITFSTKDAIAFAEGNISEEEFLKKTS